jgi:helicase
MYPIWEIAPRYLQWLAGQGYLGTVHPWVAIVAGDLSRRIRWRQAGARRGAGRLLWMCEQMATSLHAANDTPTLYAAAVRRGITNPDWTTNARPSGCRLETADYVTLLRDRTTNTTIEPQPAGAKITAPTGAVIVTWSGADTEVTQSAGDPVACTFPASPAASGAGVFTRRGDGIASGWLDAYRSMTG